jgi:uncharacterized protein
MAESTWNLTLTLLPGLYTICRLAPDAPIPVWARTDAPAVSVLSITRTANELSIVCPQAAAPADATADRDWRCLRVEGPFDLTTDVGVLAALATPLAAASIGIFAVSTYDTDHLLVHAANLDRAADALTAAGHTIRR